MKKTLYSAFAALIVGGLVGYFIQPVTGISATNVSNLTNFKEIALNNCILILAIYLISIINSLVPRLIIMKSLFVLGLTLTWITLQDVTLLKHIIPHGILELPSILSCAYIIEFGKKIFYQKPQRYAILLSIHLMVTVLIAIIEAFVTTLL
jgi:uncharacterized membrane protein SpoIIM required for sporulation